MKLTFQPVTLAASNNDDEGMLVFRDGHLLGVLSRLSEIHDNLAGLWFIEALFDRGPEYHMPTFESLEDVESWLRSTCR